MPLYEYQCSACSKVFETMQKFSDAPLSECPECNGPVSKLVSMSSFSLKGSGWYTTDYKKAKAPIPSVTPASPAPAVPAAPAPVVPPATVS
ncbi:FmdB family zinc ribbon protein [Bdellovibrionota bacterium FG-1]